MLQASLHKWYEYRFGVERAKHRESREFYRSGPDIDEEVEAYCQHLKSNSLADSTVTAHRNSISMFLGWAFPDRPLLIEAITPKLILEYLATAKSHLKPKSRKTEAGRLVSHLRFAAERTNRIANEYLIKPAAWGDSLPRKVEERELAALLSVGGDTEQSTRTKAAILLMGNLGLRCCEVAALTLDGIDFRKAVITIPATKGDFERRLPLDVETGAMLSAYIVDHRPRSMCRNIFLRHKKDRGEAMSTSQIRGSVRSHARLAGLGDFGTHMLRRRAATRLVETGTPLKIVADMMGHAEMQTTKTYLRLDDEGLRDAAADWPGDGE